MTQPGDGRERNTAKRGSHLRSGPTGGRQAGTRKPWELPSSQRDALTGTPLSLDAGAIVLVSRDWRLASEDARRGKPYRDLPRQIDTSRPYDLGEPTTVASRRNYLGGLEWTPEAKRFFRDVMPAGIERAYDAWRDWWTWPYIVERLTLRYGSEKMGATLAWVRDDEHPASVARRYNHTLTWVATSKARIVSTVRREYLTRDLLRRIDLFAQMVEHERAS